MNISTRVRLWQVLWGSSWRIAHGVYTPSSPLFRRWQIGPVHVRRFYTWPEVQALRAAARREGVA